MYKVVWVGPDKKGEFADGCVIKTFWSKEIALSFAEAFELSNCDRLNPVYGCILVKDVETGNIVDYVEEMNNLERRKDNA